MLLLLLAIAQPASSITTGDAEPPVLTTSPAKCGTPAKQKSGEIVVCAKRSEGYRIGPVAPPAPALPRAQLQISENVGAKIDLEQETISGFPSNRVMLSVKIRF
jgi:hypothetical protein